MSFRSATPPRALQQKDRIVRKLKAQILPLKQTEHTLPMLQHTARELIERIRVLGSEKGLVESEFRMRIEEAQRTLTELKAEYERLKGVGRTLQLEQTDLNADNNALKAHLQKSNLQLQRLRKQADSLYCTNQLLIIQTNKLLHSQSCLTQDLHHLHQTSSSLSLQNTDLTSRLASTKSLTSNLQSQKQAFIDAIRKFEDLNNQMEAENGERDQAQEMRVLEARKRDEGIKMELQRMMEAESKVKKVRNQMGYTVERLRVEAERGRDMEMQIKNAEKCLKDTQNHLQLEETACRDIAEENRKAHEANTKISEDMILCETHLENLMIQNDMLNRELEKFAQEDEMIQRIVAARRRMRPLTEYVFKNSRLNMTGY